MSRSDRITLAAGGGALILAAAAAWLVFAPVEAPASDPAADFAPLGSTAASMPPSAAPSPSGTIVVDIQGGVLEPGVRELPAGSRIADAIAAAGGYATDADLDAAATAINLAQALADGEQVRVPRIGEAQVAAGGVLGSAAPATGGDGGGGGMVNLNTASPEQLEALPGIGPVTVQKIVAARQEQPFASLDDAVQRGVINRGQLEDIQGAWPPLAEAWASDATP